MHRALLTWGPRLGTGYLRLVGATTRCRIEGELAGPCLAAAWHNRLLGLVVPFRDRQVGVPISLSDDGELISRVAERFGFVPLRGSSSRGGSRVMRAMLRHLAAGHDVGFTPDGPRGPRYTVQPGIALLARRTGLPVVPAGVGMTRKKVFASWDRFQLPLPFGSILIRLGAPLRFTEEQPLAEVQESIRRALVAVTDAADRALGVVSP